MCPRLRLPRLTGGVSAGGRGGQGALDPVGGGERPQDHQAHQVGVGGAARVARALAAPVYLRLLVSGDPLDEGAAAEAAQTALAVVGRLREEYSDR
ncbi:hypothetical protein [Nocardiopsis changdeensis]|uniref:hypothetical protein n=1 Tax=Nocardiopsis changdeensis TaxID=2831969 RepID=UPI003F44CFCC